MFSYNIFPLPYIDAIYNFSSSSPENKFLFDMRTVTQMKLCFILSFRRSTMPNFFNNNSRQAMLTLSFFFSVCNNNKEPIQVKRERDRYCMYIKIRWHGPDPQLVFFKRLYAHHINSNSSIFSQSLRQNPKKKTKNKTKSYYCRRLDESKMRTMDVIDPITEKKTHTNPNGKLKPP